MSDAAMSVLSGLVLDSGQRWAEVATDWQIADARAVLGEEGPPFHFLTRPRGGSKTSDLSAAAIALLLTLPPRSRCYWAAADAGQAELAIDVAAGFLARTPALRGALEVQARRVIARATDSTLDVVEAHAPSAWGTNPSAVFVDELANWQDGPAARRLWEALSSAAAKRSDSRLVVLTTPSTPTHFAYAVLEHARTDPRWRSHEVREPPPWLDPERVDEQRARLPASVFAQLFLGDWTQAEGSFLDAALVEALFTLDGPAVEAEPGRRYAAGLDLGHANDSSALAVMHRAKDGAACLDRLATWVPAKGRPVDFAAVERFVLAAHERFGFRLRLDPWQGIALAQRLREAGVRAEEFHFGSGTKQRLASVLLEAVNTGGLRLYDDDDLRHELLELRLRQSASGAWSWDHPSGGHDDRVTALALALVELSQAKRRAPIPDIGPVSVTRGAPAWGATGWGR